MKKNPRTRAPKTPSHPDLTPVRALAPAELATATGGDRGGVIVQRDGGVIIE